MDASCVCGTGIGVVVGAQFHETLMPYIEKAKTAFASFWNENLAEHVGNYRLSEGKGDAGNTTGTEGRY